VNQALTLRRLGCGRRFVGHQQLLAVPGECELAESIWIGPSLSNVLPKMKYPSMITWTKCSSASVVTTIACVAQELSSKEGPFTDSPTALEPNVTVKRRSMGV
jgi:hypothetical protein